MLSLHFVTLFPELVLPGLRHSILGRAEKARHVNFEATNPRDFTTDAHHTVDDRPFGGGPGMLMGAEPLVKALETLQITAQDRVIVPDPCGRLFCQNDAQEWSRASRLIFLCGRYEGIDERVLQTYATDRVSLGDFILTGGELAAMVMADALVRLIPGVLGDSESLQVDSHNDGLLSYPQYTRPREILGVSAPDVLFSGDHGAIENWRRTHAVRMTRAQRPDLFCQATLERGDLHRL